MSENSAAPAPASNGSITTGTASERLLAGIGDDFDLDTDDSGEGSEPTRTEKPRAKPKKPETAQPTSLDDADFADESPDESTNTPRPHDPEPRERVEEPEEPERPQFGPKDRGTKEKPMSIKDLPEDRFLRIKVDGKEETVSLRDAVRGFIRKETFDRVYSRVNHDAQRVLELGQRAIDLQKGITSELQSFLTNPRTMLDWCMKYAPETADAFAKLYANEYLRKWHDNPDEKLHFEHSRKMRQLQEQTEAQQQQQRDWERQRAIAERTEEKKRLLAPGYAQGMKEAGFPKMTEDFRATLHALLGQVSKVRPLTPDDVRMAVVRTARLLRADTVQNRKPAPIPNTPRETVRSASKPNGKGRDWSQVPYAERVRNVDFILRR